jgi:hypothetical protein
LACIEAFDTQGSGIDRRLERFRLGTAAAFCLHPRVSHPSMPRASLMAPWTAVFLSIVATFALAAGEAAAGTATSSLSWVRLPGAESCITVPELGSRIENHLGRKALVSPSAGDVAIEARVARIAGGRYKATVGGTRRDGTPLGTRELVSPTSDCRSLDDGLVLVVALMIDPDALEPARAAIAAPPPPPPPPSPVEKSVTREVVHERIIVHEVERVPVPAPAWRVQAALSGAASVARVPGVAPAATFTVRAGPSRLVAFELTLGVVPLQTLDVDAHAVDYTLVEGGLAYCPTVALGHYVSLGGCAGLRAGAIRSRGRAFAANSEIDRGLVDIALGPHLMVDVARPVFLILSATALAPLVRQETTVTSGGTVVVLDRRSVLGGEVGLGAGVRFSP